ncbi:LOW QUALITY PROTEIN: small ribosomal subunit protein eS27-like [Urocitellus parryii]
MDSTGPGCCKITFFSQQRVVLCVAHFTVLCQPTGRKARLTGGWSFKRKQHPKHSELR